jgi:dTDP-4-amino-4,6-dideoxygalactose transaminase
MTTSSPFTLRLFEPDIGAEERQAVLQVIESGMLSMGAMVEAFEDTFAQFLGVRHAIAVSSATAALHLAHHVMGIGAEDEVIVPSLTFVATANSVVYTGATPVFSDIIGEQDLNIDPDDVAQRITSRTRGIVVVHYAGYPVDMDRIMHLADQHGLYVVEDASHAPGSMYHGKPLGTIGQVGCFSFYTNKNMTTAEGGMVVTDDENLAQRIRRMRSHGMTTVTWDRIRGHAYSYDVTDLGFNYRIDEMRAALGIVQLKHLPERNKRRQMLMKKYLTGLSQNRTIVAPFGSGAKDVSYHICPVLLTDGTVRDSIMTDMRNQGVQTSIHYPPTHLFSLYRERYGCRLGMLPVTEDIAQREMTLPLYPSMCEDDVDHVLDVLDKSLTTVAAQKET